MNKNIWIGIIGISVALSLIFTSGIASAANETNNNSSVGPVDLNQSEHGVNVNKSGNGTFSFVLGKKKTKGSGMKVFINTTLFTRLVRGGELGFRADGYRSKKTIITAKVAIRYDGLSNSNLFKNPLDGFSTHGDFTLRLPFLKGL